MVLITQLLEFSRLEANKISLESITPELFQFYLFGFGFIMSAAYLVRPTARKEVFKTTKIFTLPRTSTIIAGIVNLREQIITIFNMGELLFNSSEDKTLDSAEKESIIVLVNIKNQDIGLLVDQVIHLTDIKELGELDLKELKNNNLKLTPAITNVAVADDSSSYLLDIEKMFKDYDVDFPDDMKGFRGMRGPRHGRGNARGKPEKNTTCHAFTCHSRGQICKGMSSRRLSDKCRTCLSYYQCARQSGRFER